MSLWDLEENITKLKELWAEGYAASKIAEVLGTTRNAAIGKLHRLGLTRPKEERPKKAKPVTVSRLAHIKSVKGDRIPPALHPLINGNGLSILELTYNSCRAIINNKNDRYCGMETADGQSFCPGHRELYYRSSSLSDLPDIG